MKVILLYTINDLSAYRHLSGCRTVGKYGCHVCREGTKSKWLKYGQSLLIGAYKISIKYETPFKEPEVPI